MYTGQWDVGETSADLWFRVLGSQEESKTEDAGSGYIRANIGGTDIRDKDERTPPTTVWPCDAIG